jgi:asparagine synthase (glutamine-hydrolysing)
MCAILGIFGHGARQPLHDRRRQALQLSQRQRHRGPDWNGIYIDQNAILAHERLAIVDPAGGAQPMLSADRQLALTVNGEIYNHRALKQRLARPYRFLSGSDCEVINALYRDGSEPAVWLNQLNGIFAFALWDAARGRTVIARDPIGVCSLYWGHDREGRLCVASEIKALADLCDDVAQFPPGHVYDSLTGALTRYYNRPWRDYDATAGVRLTPDELRCAFEAAVQRQLMADVPFGVLLSGGLDSSLVAACAVRLTRQARRGGNTPVWGERLHSFAIGLEDSRDLAAAAVVAESLGTVHHGFRYEFDEGWDALPEVIRHVETYDVTTVRASTPMFLLARRIKAIGVKMVLSGEGADEVFGGYLYFHKAPDARAFHDETVRKLDTLCHHDCLRLNKAMLAWGVEPRVPFLDTEFLDAAMKLDARAKMIQPGRIEKAVLREAFTGCLPNDILWRQKEQFSDGVGYSWIDGLKAACEHEVSDADLAGAPERFPVNPPSTKEAYFYRSLFDRWFPGESCARTVPAGKSIACSTPAALAWDPSFLHAADPSGRAVAGIHHATASAVAPVSR